MEEINRRKKTVGRIAAAKPLPFALDLLDKRHLTSQLACGIRKAIDEGYYLPGDILPSFSEMAGQLNVSLIVVRGAVSVLAEEKRLMVRHGYGSIVLDASSRVWKGSVLFVTTDHKAIYLTYFIKNALRRRLRDMGYLFDAIVVEREEDGSYDFSQLKVRLDGFVKLAIVYHNVEEVLEFLRSKKVPCFIRNCLNERNSECGSIEFDFSRAIADFVERVRTSSIRTVWQIGLGPQYDKADVVNRLELAGISVERKEIHPLAGYFRPECYERAAMRRFLDPKDELYGPFPDLLYFSDDYIASGALTALSARGISIPEEVKVVSFANRGLGPVFPKELTRIEIDARKIGEEYAKGVLAVLLGQDKLNFSVSAEFLVGDTF